MTLRPQGWGLSVAGQVMLVNEDSILMDNQRGVFLVSDGLGGHQGAAVASRVAVQATAAALVWPAEQPRKALLRAVRCAAEQLGQRARERAQLRRMAATLTVLAFDAEAVWIAHIGDSRAYRARGGLLEQLTHDHSVAWEQFQAGALSKKQLAGHPNQNLLTRSLSAHNPAPVFDIAVGDVRAGDRFLLCTDGLNKELDDLRIAALMSIDEPEQLPAALVVACEERGAKDNVSVVVVAVRR